jgi:hypothetical protein
MNQMAHDDLPEAQQALRRAAAADRRGFSFVYTSFAKHPRAYLRFSDGEAPLFAPLVTLCLDAEINGALALVVSHARSRLTRARTINKNSVDVYPGEDGTELEEHANRFLNLEAQKWDLARSDGDYTRPVPYPVRYLAARFLWSPRIRGVAFCLRCGDEIRYQRVGRRTDHQPRTAPICDPCLRSGSTNWPPQALMPYDRGRWLLRCAHPGCSEPPFPARAQARYCPEHRQNRLTPSERRQ